MGLPVTRKPTKKTKKKAAKKLRSVPVYFDQGGLPR
jgi:hypothetical protein